LSILAAHIGVDNSESLSGFTGEGNRPRARPRAREKARHET